MISPNITSSVNASFWNCGICHDVMDSNACISRRCMHIFHRSCGERWLATSRSCPSCRYELSVVDLIENPNFSDQYRIWREDPQNYVEPSMDFLRPEALRGIGWEYPKPTVNQAMESFHEAVHSGYPQREVYARSEGFLNAVSTGLDAIEEGQDEVRRGQGEIRRGQSEIRRGQEEIRRGQEEIRRGQDENREQLNILNNRLDRFSVNHNELNDKLDSIQESHAEHREWLARQKSAEDFWATSFKIIGIAIVLGLVIKFSLKTPPPKIDKSIKI